MIDTFSAIGGTTGKDADNGSWTSTTAPGGAVSVAGSFTDKFTNTTNENDSDDGTDNGAGFNISATGNSKSVGSSTTYADGSGTGKVTTTGGDGALFATNDADASGSGIATNSDADHWSVETDATAGSDGSSSVSLFATDGGVVYSHDDLTGSGAIGGETDSVTRSEDDLGHFSDGVTGIVSTDASGHDVGSEFFTSSADGTVTDTAGDTGSDSSNSFSMNDTLLATEIVIDSGSVAIDPSGVSGSDNFSDKLSGTDTFSGNDTKTLPSVSDVVTTTLSGLIGGTQIDSGTTTLANNGTITTTDTVTDSGSGTLTVKQSDTAGLHNGSGTVSSGDPSSANPGVFWPFAEGVVAGDFSDNSSWSTFAGQVVGGLNPLADARDVAAGASNIWQGKAGGWFGFGSSLLGCIPVVGDTGKVVLKGGRKVATEVAQKGIERAAKEAAQQAAKEGVTALSTGAGTKWPKSFSEMDKMLGVRGTRVPDGPGSPGRGKVVWQPNAHSKITFEQHPYHLNAPDWHQGPHWHLDTPGAKHQRFLPGEPIPGMTQ